MEGIKSNKQAKLITIKNIIKILKKNNTLINEIPMKIDENNTIKLQMRKPNGENEGITKAKDWNYIMVCLGTMISFENLELAQIYCLANHKFSNLDLNQIPSLLSK